MNKTVRKKHLAYGLFFLLSACGGGGSSSDPQSPPPASSGDSDVGLLTEGGKAEDASENTLETLVETPADTGTMNLTHVPSFSYSSAKLDVENDRFYTMADSGFSPARMIWNSKTNNCIDAAMAQEEPRLFATENFIIFGAAQDDELEVAAGYVEEAMQEIEKILGIDETIFQDARQYYFDPYIRMSVQTVWGGIFFDDVPIDILAIKGADKVPSDVMEAYTQFYNDPTNESYENLQAKLYRYWMSLSKEARVAEIEEVVQYIVDMGISLNHPSLLDVPLFDHIRSIVGENRVDTIDVQLPSYTEKYQICVSASGTELGGDTAGLATRAGVVIDNPSDWVFFNNYALFEELLAHEIAHLLIHRLLVWDGPQYADTWFIEGIAEFLSDQAPPDFHSFTIKPVEIKTVEEAAALTLTQNVEGYEVYEQYNLAVSYLFRSLEENCLGNDPLKIRDIAIDIRDDPRQTGMFLHFDEDGYRSSTQRQIFNDAFNKHILDADAVTPLSIEVLEAEFSDRMPLKFYWD